MTESQLNSNTKADTMSSSSSSVSYKSPPVQEEDLPAVRSKLPVPQPDQTQINVWSILKHCIGKELSKITFPVQWNEPVSLLQRISESMAYASLLNSAADEKDASTRMQWAVAFAVSGISYNIGRLTKPFNPLLGETYELQQPDYRILFEQVGHHPPVTAFHAEGRSTKFVYRGTTFPKTKFWGKSIEFIPKGTTTLEFPEWEETYTWTLVPCVIHNIIVGKMWLEHTGVMEVVNHKTKHKCFLNFRTGSSGGWLTNSSQSAVDMHTVEGFVVDQAGKKTKFLYGKWTEFLCSVDADIAADFFDVVDLDKVDPNASNLPKHPTLLMGAVPNSQVLWEATPRSEDAANYFNFTPFTMGLNQPLPHDQQAKLCPTDCRNRPDMRALEEGELDLAAAQKERLENKQREYRKPFKGKKSESEWWTPRWFMPVKNEFTKEDDWKYLGEYWEQKGSYKNIPDIY